MKNQFFNISNVSAFPLISTHPSSKCNLKIVSILIICNKFSNREWCTLMILQMSYPSGVGIFYMLRSKRRLSFGKIKNINIILTNWCLHRIRFEILYLYHLNVLELDDISEIETGVSAFMRRCLVHCQTFLYVIFIDSLCVERMRYYFLGKRDCELKRCSIDNRECYLSQR